MRCYVHWNGGAWFVKEKSFLEEQRKQDLQMNPNCDKWWEHWKLLPDYVDGIEHARLIAEVRFGKNGEHWKKN